MFSLLDESNKGCLSSKEKCCSLISYFDERKKNTSALKLPQMTTVVNSIFRRTTNVILKLEVLSSSLIFILRSVLK